jgi:ferrous iron transport protein A
MRSENVAISDLGSGTRAVVRDIQGGKNIISRLSAMGLSVGSEVEILENRGQGPVLIRVRDTRIALGRGEALKIIVEEIGGD